MSSLVHLVHASAFDSAVGMKCTALDKAQKQRGAVLAEQYEQACLREHNKRCASQKATVLKHVMPSTICYLIQGVRAMKK